MKFKARPMLAPELAQLMGRWTRMVEALKPRGRCRGCALRPGTAANRDGDTAGRLMIVLLQGGDFRCHHTGSARGPVMRKDPPARQCRGFRALLQAMRVKDGE